MLKVEMRTSATTCAALLLAFASACAPEGWNERAEYPSAQPADAEQQVTAEAPVSPQSALDVANPAAVASGEEVPIGEEPPATAAPAHYEETDPSALTDFRAPLEPYGTWADDPVYGTVWYPSTSQVGADFTPYSTGGHWSYDGYEYVWVSDYEWGWAPFHYGRWTYIAGHGWGWIPGRVYRGAWVSWRVGPVGYGYIGWAPMAPTWYWYGGYAYGVAVVPYAPYSFCATGDLFHPHVGGRVIRGSGVGDVARGTRPYVEATPSVGSGPGRASATPGIGPENTGRPHEATTSAAYAPSPASVGINATDIVKTPNDLPAVGRAKQFGDPKLRAQFGLRTLPPRQAPQMVRRVNPETFDAPRGPGGSIGVRPPAPRPGSPHFGPAPRVGTAPPYRAPSSPTFRPSVPSYHAPSSPTFRPSTPNIRPSSPIVRPSTPSLKPPTPSHKPSAPSRPSRGGRR